MGYVYLILEGNIHGEELTDEQVISFIDDCKEADKSISFLLKNNPFFN
jgi:hypothetical protein